MILRTLAFALALGAPGLAAADPFPRSAQDAPVVSDTGAVVGHVRAVERNARGEIVAVEAPGLEPPDASEPPTPLVAERERARQILVSAPARADGVGPVLSRSR